MPSPPHVPSASPRLTLRSFDRGDGLLGLRPCGPVLAPKRTPLFGARGPQVTLAWLAADDASAQARLRATGLQPLPANALQWRGDDASALPTGRALFSLVREADFGDFWADALPALQAEGWAITLCPGFAHASLPVSAWHIDLKPLTQPRGLGSWMLSLGLTIQTRDGSETLDLVPLLARLIQHDRRWTQADALDAIADDALIRLHAPGGRRIDALAAPLKAIARALLDLLTQPRRPKQGDGLLLTSWDAQRLAMLRAGLRDAMASHPSARRDLAQNWELQGEAGLAWLDQAGTTPPPVAVPAGLGLVLRPYQREGLAWLQHLRRHALAGILADDMGLGKTAQALAHLLVEQHAGRLALPALVVAPASLIFNWQAEAARVAPALRLLTLQGPQRATEIARMPEFDVVLTSYPLLWRDAMALQRQPWHIVILDESQMVKNAGSRTATAARRLNARHRLSLTGTPMENHLGELWAQFHFLLPGYLGDARSFVRDWRTPIEKNAETARARLLAQRVAPFILRRRKDQVATELPALTEQVHRVALAGTQRTLYESVRLASDEQVRRVLARQKFSGAMVSILDALLRLRQVCNDPRLLESPMTEAERLKPSTLPSARPSNRTGNRTSNPTLSSPRGSPHPAAPIDPLIATASAKIEWLRATLPTLVAEGRRILVFSQFTRMLRLIEAELAALGIAWLSLTGDTPPAQRGARVAQFQQGQTPVFLVSLRAGGVGLNLTAADTVIHVDPWWNPAVEQQASARAHRIGQTRPVTVYRLVVAGSIEERLLALQARKAALAEAVLGDGFRLADGASTPFAAEDLPGLLAPLSD